MKTINTLKLLMFVVLFAGCSEGITSTPMASISQTPEARPPLPILVTSTVTITAAIEPTPTVTATSLPIIAITIPLSTTVTPIVTATPIIPPDVVNNKCLEVADSLPPDAAVGGVIVLVDYRGQATYLMDMQTGTITPLPRQDNQKFGRFFVSPNRRWLASIITTDAEGPANSLVIFTADGLQYQSIPVPEGLVIAEWLNDEHLVMVSSKWDGETLQPLTLLNPFTEQLQELVQDYPDMDNFSQLIWGPYSGSTRTVYDPVLSRVLYPRFGTGIVLWDIQAQKALAEIWWKFPDTYGQNPKWSPDGEQATVVGDLGGEGSSIQYKDEFFSFDKDGEIKQLTHMSDYYNSVAIVREYDWSPDGRRIAFLMSNESNPFLNEQLAILDTLTGQVTNYSSVGNYSNYSTPVWSPDGTQVVIAALTSDLKQVQSVILVDIVNGYAAQIAKDVWPMGWLAITP